MTNNSTNNQKPDDKVLTTSLFKAMFLSAILLGFFGVIGTLSVSSVYNLTAPTIEKNIQQKLLKTLSSVIPDNSYDNDLLSSTIEIGPSQLLSSQNKTIVYQAKLNNDIVAIAFKTTAPDGYSGNISILIGVLTNGNISSVRVISHKETPGLGDKIDIQRSNWIHSFENTNLDIPDKKHWKVKKDGGYFDQFSGATITPRAVVKAVYKALVYVKKNKQLLFEVNNLETVKE
ncbi:MAG: electron transport complex subunit RsxG [Gammaproteobacteria bacterium]|nr:electron transport complex subunit RsxG [Gammaproteobacteria bacterium]